MAQLDRESNPSLFVFNHCVNAIKEFESYRWKEKLTSYEDVNDPDIPEKSNDHIMDALRYCMVSHGSFKQNDYWDFPEQKLFKGGFY